MIKLEKDQRTMADKILEILISLIIALIVLFLVPCFVKADEIITQASWYNRASCAREGTSGIMANGKELDDGKLTAASWDYPMGVLLDVRNIKTGKVVRVLVTDRGPARRLYRVGRKLDVSQAAFSKLADLKQGVICVSVQPVK